MFMKAKQENRLEKQLHQLSYARVLMLDKIGYLPTTREEGSLFFRLLNRRYEEASIMLTSNLGFDDNVLATAIVDPLLHHLTTLNIKGESLAGNKSGGVGFWARPKMCRYLWSEMGHLTKKQDDLFGNIRDDSILEHWITIRQSPTTFLRS